jgi:hypothetical protein
MAQVYGFLRTDQATHGEKIVYKRLKDNLPKEYSVYVECPLPGKRMHRFPDFIVLTNYGVIILEVKDWIYIEWADRYGAQIRMRNNKPRKVGNPVSQAREIALLLAKELNTIKDSFRYKEQLDIPWGYAVVLPNLPTSTITQLRAAWGDEFVLNSDDLDPALILSRLKVTLPQDKVRDLKKYELDFVRATINPTVLIEPQGKPAVILDNEQEGLVSEPVKEEPAPTKAQIPKVEQRALFVEMEPPTGEESEALSPVEEKISKNTSIRLVRGVSGSGKTLVLAQRARYLAAQFPEWKILVLTYNRQLRQHFEAIFKGFPNIKPMTFHKLCKILLLDQNSWKEPTNPNDWLSDSRADYPIINQLGTRFLADEIQWIKETDIPNKEIYLTVERKGRGSDRRISRELREQIYDVLLGYQTFLDEQGLLDWANIPHLVSDGLRNGEYSSPEFDAVLIDESQDFAPVWIKLVTRLLNPDHGVFFLADDPAQSIYRFYSWKEKGVHVVGRTRWLRVPYRNTFEIYQAAYQLIATDPGLQKSLEEEGLLVIPELNHESMRHGIKPLIRRYENFDQEINHIRSQIDLLLREGVDSRQIAVLHRKRSGVEQIEAGLKGCDVRVDTFHAFKGLEFEVVFLTQLQETRVYKSAKQNASAERRLVYMAMTRAREKLYMGYSGKLPEKYSAMKGYTDFVQ